MTHLPIASVPTELPHALRALAGFTAAIAVVALLLQYHLLLRTPGLGAADATLRYLGYFTILSNIGVAAVCLALARGRREGLAGPVPRAAVALFIGITGLIYVIILRPLWHPQGAQWWADTGLHYGVPVLYLLGWLAGRTAWRPASAWVAQHTGVPDGLPRLGPAGRAAQWAVPVSLPGPGRAGHRGGRAQCAVRGGGIRGVRCAAVVAGWRLGGAPPQPLTHQLPPSSCS